MKYMSSAGRQVQNNVTAAQGDACVQSMATRETSSLHDQSGSCFVEESFFSVISEPGGHKSLEVNDEGYTLARVNNDQEREDVCTTTLGGEVNPRCLKVCKRWWKKRTMRTDAQETLGF